MVIIAFAVIALIGYVGCWQYFRRLQDSQEFEKTIWPILGVMIPVVGMFVGWKYWILGGARRPNSVPQNLSNASIETLLDIIDDNSSASLTVTNSTWLQNNWHNMKYTEKVDWVTQREKHLKDHLIGAIDEFTFIQAMQDADKGYLREALKRA